MGLLLCSCTHSRKSSAVAWHLLLQLCNSLTRLVHTCCREKGAVYLKLQDSLYILFGS